MALSQVQEDRFVELIKMGIDKGEVLRQEQKGPLEAKLKEGIKSEISTLYAQTQFLPKSAKEDRAKSKEHNASMT